MNPTAAVMLLTAVIGLSGCGYTTEQYQESLRRECKAKGFVEQTKPFEECVARELHRDHDREPGAKGVRGRRHGWQDDLD
jgi:hypothetical protein